MIRFPATRSLVFLGVCLAGVVAMPVSAQSWRPTNGPAGGEIRAFTSHNNALFVAARASVWRSTDNGTSWDAASTGLPPLAQMTSLATTDTAIYVGTAARGLWRSEDNGVSWIDATGDLPARGIVDVEAFGPSLLALNSPNASFGGALYRSEDAGTTWTMIATPEEFSVIHARGGVLYGSGFLFTHHSTDGGATWTPQNTGLPIFTTILSITSNNDFVFAVSATAGLFRSADNGLNWTHVSPPVDASTIAAFVPGASDGYLLARQSGAFAIWRTVDNGTSWTQSPEFLPVGTTSARAALQIAGTDELFAGTGTGVFFSEDAGASFVDANDGLVGTAVTSLDGFGQRLIATANNKLVFSSVDAGGTWQQFTAGLEAEPRITRIKMLDENNALLGTASQGVFRSQDGGATWAPVNSGITGFNGSAGQQFHQINDFADNGVAVIASSGGGTISLGGEHGSGGFGIAADGIFRSTNDGASWQRVTSGIPLVATAQSGDPVFAYVDAVAAVNGVFFASMPSRGILRSTNNGQSWTTTNSGLPSPNNVFPEISAFVSFDGFVFASNRSSSPFSPTPGVFRFNAGTNQWSSAAAGLPNDRPVRDLLVWDGQLIASVGATNPGDVVLFSSTDGANWLPYTPSLRELPVGTLVGIDAGVFASTNGRGVWTLETSLVGDTNCDGIISVSDIAPFVLALTDPSGYAATFPDCNLSSADINNNGVVSVGDIGAFVSLLTGA